MVSDVLSDALHELKGYVEEPLYHDWYREEDGTVWEPLRECMEKMNQVCMILDTPPELLNRDS
jgi:hypothetical protein